MFQSSRFGHKAKLKILAGSSATEQVANLFKMLAQLFSHVEEYAYLPFMTKTLASPIQAADLDQFERLADESYSKMIEILVEADRSLPETWDDV